MYWFYNDYVCFIVLLYLYIMIYDIVCFIIFFNKYNFNNVHNNDFNALP